jgi:hypothetical protein
MGFLDETFSICNNEECNKENIRNKGLINENKNNDK